MIPLHLCSISDSAISISSAIVRSKLLTLNLNCSTDTDSWIALNSDLILIVDSSIPMDSDMNRMIGLTLSVNSSIPIDSASAIAIDFLLNLVSVISNVSSAIVLANALTLLTISVNPISSDMIRSSDLIRITDSSMLIDSAILTNLSLNIPLASAIPNDSYNILTNGLTLWIYSSTPIDSESVRDRLELQRRLKDEFKKLEYKNRSSNDESLHNKRMEKRIRERKMQIPKRSRSRHLGRRNLPHIPN